MSRTQHGLYGLLAEFDDADSLLAAADTTRRAGYTRIDAFTPYPVEGLSHALGFRHTRLPAVVLAGGLIGCATGYLLQYLTAVVAYPLDVGGRPLHSWPAFVPVTFELTILFAAIAAVVGMLGLNHLPAPYHPVFNVEQFERATRDGFFLCIKSRDPKFDPDDTSAFLSGLGPKGVHTVET